MIKLPKAKREQLLQVALGTVLVLAALWIGVISQQLSVLGKRDTSVADLEQKLAEAKRTLSREDEINAELAAKTARIQAIEDTMAQGDLYSWIILTMNRFKSKHRVEIPDFSRELRGPVGLFPDYPYEAATFTLRGTARYHDFGMFLADFEREHPFMRVQGLSIEPAKEGEPATQEKLEFKMEIVALIKPVE